MELADLVVVNKADGDLAAAATRAQADYTNALHLLRPRWRDWTTSVLACSALEGRGVAEVWTEVERFVATVTDSGELAQARARQAVAWMWSEVQDTLIDQLRHDPRVVEVVAALEDEVAAGRTGATAAARILLERFDA